MEEIRTSNPDWFRDVCKSYKGRVPFTLIDDAKLGIDPRLQSALEMGIKGRLSRHEILACFLSLGLGAAGAYMIALAILDPEPTSKLTVLLAGGVGFIGIGGLSVLRLLTKETPTTINLGHGFGLSWAEPAPRYTDIRNYGGVPPYVPTPDPFRPPIG